MENNYINNDPNIRLVARRDIVAIQAANRRDCLNYLLDLLEMNQERAMGTTKFGPFPWRGDSALRDVLSPRLYSIQNVPGDGSCFFYTIVMILLHDTKHYSLGNPSEIVFSAMKCLRAITASTIYESPLLLEFLMANNEYVADMKLDINGRPDAQAYFDYFLVNKPLPYADNYEVQVVQGLPMFSNTALLVYNSNGLDMSFVCHGMRIPEEVHAIVLLRRSGDSHYEPVVFNVDGEWQHRLPIYERNNPQYQALFQRIFAQCPGLMEKIFH